MAQINPDYQALYNFSYDANWFEVQQLMAWYDDPNIGKERLFNWLNTIRAKNEKLNIYKAPFLADVKLAIRRDDEAAFIRYKTVTIDGYKCKKCGGVELSIVTTQKAASDEQMALDGICIACGTINKLG